MSKFLTIALAFVIFHSKIYSQSDSLPSFKSPLHIPLYLAGNYGELRSDHFHAGLDLKTLGEIGQPVYSAQSGYISRIKIQGGGYGRALYVRHADGITTVYGHLDHFMPEVQDYLTKNQYEKHSYEIDLYPPKDLFVVKQGQQIAFSGNTGYSGGPHVHFEIRRNDGEIPLNGLRFELPVIDKQNPEFKCLVVYSLIREESVGNDGEIRKEYPVSRISDSVYQINGIIEGQANYIGFGSEVYDYMNGSTNQLGVYSLELKIDGITDFSFALDNLSFSQSFYVDAHMDYDLYVNEDKSVHRLFKLPNNNLPIYKIRNGNGLFQFTDDSVHKAEIKASDAYGNTAIVKFKFKKKPDLPEDTIDITQDKSYVQWDKGKNFQFGDLRIFIPPQALFRDILFNYSRKTNGINILKDTFNVYTDREPIAKNFTLQLTYDSIPEKLKDKVLFTRIKKNNKLSAESTEWFEGKITSFARNFGKYVLMFDTIPPKIIPVNLIDNKQYFDGQQLSFQVTDELSGLKMVNGYIDEKWILLEYDPKTDIVTYTIDKNRLRKGKLYVLKIFAMDQKNNISVFAGKFRY